MNTPNLFYDTINNIIYLNNEPTAEFTGSFYIVKYISDIWDHMYGKGNWVLTYGKSRKYFTSFDEKEMFQNYAMGKFCWKLA